MNLTEGYIFSQIPGRVCYPNNLTPQVGTRVWRADQVRARRDRVGSRVYPITLRSSRVGIPPTKIPVPAAFYPGIGYRVSGINSGNKWRATHL
eukprot:scaffold17626_cov47-Cyclotella_meneghiniana.AAC.3